VTYLPSYPSGGKRRELMGAQMQVVRSSTSIVMAQISSVAPLYHAWAHNAIPRLGASTRGIVTLAEVQNALAVCQRFYMVRGR